MLHFKTIHRDYTDINCNFTVITTDPLTLSKYLKLLKYGFHCKCDTFFIKSKNYCIKYMWDTDLIGPIVSLKQ